MSEKTPSSHLPDDEQETVFVYTTTGGEIDAADAYIEEEVLAPGQGYAARDFDAAEFGEDDDFECSDYDAEFDAVFGTGRHAGQCDGFG